MHCWRPIPQYIFWSVNTDEQFKEVIFKGIHILCWLMIYLMMISMDITDLFGIKQVSKRTTISTYNFYKRCFSTDPIVFYLQKSTYVLLESFSLSTVDLKLHIKSFSNSHLLILTKLYIQKN